MRQAEAEAGDEATSAGSSPPRGVDGARLLGGSAGFFLLKAMDLVDPRNRRGGGFRRVPGVSGAVGDTTWASLGVPLWLDPKKAAK